MDKASKITFDKSVLYPSTLKYSQNIVMDANMYQPDAGGPYNKPGIGKTWCNQSTYDIADLTGFNQQALYDGKNRYDTNANTAISNLEKAVEKDQIQSTTNPTYAQMMANKGNTVIAGKPNSSGSGHLSTVTPSVLSPTLNSGAMVANVGASNGTMTVEEAFGTTKGVVYYYDKNQSFQSNGNGLAKEKK